MSEAIERYISHDQIEIMKRAADAYFASGYFDGVKSMAQAFVKISAGAEMGLLPFEAMMGIDLIDGKQLSLNAQLMSTKVKEHAKYDYRVRRIDAEACTLVFYELGEEIGESTFTMEDAERANLTGPTRNGALSNYVKYPRNMLFARAMTNGVAWFCPDVTRSHVFLDATSATPAPTSGIPAVAPVPTPTPAVEPAEEVHDAEIVDETEVSQPGGQSDVTLSRDPPAADGTTEAGTSATEEPHRPAAPPEPPPASAIDPAERGQLEGAFRLELTKLNPDDRKLVREACKVLGIAWDASTSNRILDRFFRPGITSGELLADLLEAGIPGPPPAAEPMGDPQEPLA